MPQMEMDHSTDPKADLIERLGDLSQVDLFHNQVLLAIYIRPEKTKSGIILTDKYRDEDKYQSKVGMVVKMGDLAFDDPTDAWFKGVNVSMNDWVVYRPSDGWSININGVDCRVLDDVNARMRIPTPDMVW